MSEVELSFYLIVFSPPLSSKGFPRDYSLFQYCTSIKVPNFYIVDCFYPVKEGEEESPFKNGLHSEYDLSSYSYFDLS